MLSSDLIADLIGATPGGRRNNDDARVGRIPWDAPGESLDEATRKLSARWVAQWREFARSIFDSDELSRYPIYVLPSPAFGAESILADGMPCVLVHHGAMELMSFAVECDLLSGQAARSVGESASGQQILRRIDALTHFIFRSHMKDPARLPKLSQWLTEASRKAWLFHVLGAETFILLHEIGHIRLGHLENNLPDGREAVAQRQRRREFEADAFAFKMTTRGHEMLLLGAWSFLWWFSYYQAWEGAYANYYPTAVARFEALLKTHSGDLAPHLQEELTGMQRIADFLHAGGHREDLHDFNRGELGTCEDAQGELSVIFHTLLT